MLYYLNMIERFAALPQWRISEHFTVNQAQMLIEALHSDLTTSAPLRQTAVVVVFYWKSMSIPS